MSPRFRPFTRALLVLALLCTAALPAGAQESEPPLPENPFERLAEVRRQQAEAALAIDLLNASAVEVQSRLAQVESWVAAQEDVVAAAQADLVAANVAAGEARTAEEVKAAELADLEALMRDIAVEAFIRPGRWRDSRSSSNATSTPRPRQT